jgi:hypothetical protein
MNRAAPLSISHWLGACVIAQLMGTASGSGAPQAWPSIVGIHYPGEPGCRLSSFLAELLEPRR